MAPKHIGAARPTATLPEGTSLRRVAQVLVDAWEVGSERWRASALQLREDGATSASPPVPEDVLKLFRVLHERKVPYLLVGGIAMLAYVQGRNTKDVDLLTSVRAMEQIPDFHVEDRKDWFARARFRSLQVDLLLTSNPVFELVAKRFATTHRFAELEVPAATPEGLVLLKLYALPSLYRQLDTDRLALYENDIAMLLARHPLKLEPLLEILGPHIEPGDVAELRKIAAECSDRADKLRARTNR